MKNVYHKKLYQGRSGNQLVGIWTDWNPRHPSDSKHWRDRALATFFIGNVEVLIIDPNLQHQLGYLVTRVLICTDPEDI